VEANTDPCGPNKDLLAFMQAGKQCYWYPWEWVLHIAKAFGSVDSGLTLVLACLWPPTVLVISSCIRNQVLLKIYVLVL